MVSIPLITWEMQDTSVIWTYTYYGNLVNSWSVIMQQRPDIEYL